MLFELQIYKIIIEKAPPDLPKGEEKRWEKRE